MVLTAAEEGDPVAAGAPPSSFLHPIKRKPQITIKLFTTRIILMSCTLMISRIPQHLLALQPNLPRRLRHAWFHRFHHRRALSKKFHSQATFAGQFILVIAYLDD